MFGRSLTPEEFSRETRIKSNITQKFGKSIKSLQRNHVNSTVPIQSEEVAIQLCSILEAAFLHGLKESYYKMFSGFLLKQEDGPSFWHFLLKISHTDVVSQLTHLGQITSEIGMCRAWIRLAVNDGLLESYIDTINSDMYTLRTYYKRTAYLRDPEEPGILKSYIQGLADFKFRLPYNSSVLNIWTNTPLMLAGLIENMQTPAPVVSPRSSDTGLHDRPTKRSRQRSGSSSTAQLPQSPTREPYEVSHMTRDQVDAIKQSISNVVDIGEGSEGSGSHVSVPDLSYRVDSGLYSRTSSIEERILSNCLDVEISVPGSIMIEPNSSSEKINTSMITQDSDSRIALETDNFHHKSNKESYPPFPSPPKPLEPVLTTVTAKVETIKDGSEDSMTKTLQARNSIYDRQFSLSESIMESDKLDLSGAFDSSHFQESFTAGGNAVEENADVSFSEKPAGNSLGRMSGWSSSYDDQLKSADDCTDSGVTNESRDYENSPTMDAVSPRILREFGNVEAATLSASMQIPSNSDDDHKEFEVLPLGSSVTSENADSQTQNLVGMIATISNEKGLDFQNYQCYGCSRPVGMIYGKARVCAYDGAYYCFECHENEQHCIPAKILHSWDFKKYEVCRASYEFLEKISEEPLIDVKHSNPSLYEHVSIMKDTQLLRRQLRYIKSYLFTCSQSVADDLRKQVWPKEYLYDSIHLYSLNDFLQIQSGHLLVSLKKIIKHGMKHVYECRLCKQKGFVCEICRNALSIYPFEVDTTYRCGSCKAVYHKQCKSDSRKCPKCERRHSRQSQLGRDIKTPETMDYGFVW